MAQETPIHAGDRVVITHGPDAKQHRGKVWVVETALAPCPCCGELAVTLKGYRGDHTSGTYRPDQSGRLPGAVSVT